MALSWDRSPALPPFPGGFGSAGLQGRSLQGFHEVPSMGNGQAGGVSSRESPHSLQDLAEAASPLPKTPRNPLRGRNSHELEQL